MWIAQLSLWIEFHGSCAGSWLFFGRDENGNKKLRVNNLEENEMKKLTRKKLMERKLHKQGGQTGDALH
jgi:hypothetical protein